MDRILIIARVLAALGVLLAAGCSQDGGGGESAAAGGDQAEDAGSEARDHSGEGDKLSFGGTDAMWNADEPLAAPVASFGDEPAWTETTHGAANKGTTGKRATVIGEVVDVSCYMQLGKRGEAHIPCGTNCVENGAPIGLVDDRNQLFIVMAEEHDPRRYGNVALKEALLPFMAQVVQVTGMLTEREGVKTLYVLGYTVGESPNQPKGE